MGFQAFSGFDWEIHWTLVYCSIESETEKDSNANVDNKHLITFLLKTHNVKWNLKSTLNIWKLIQSGKENTSFLFKYWLTFSPTSNAVSRTSCNCVRTVEKWDLIQTKCICSCSKTFFLDTKQSLISPSLRNTLVQWNDQEFLLWFLKHDAKSKQQPEHELHTISQVKVVYLHKPLPLVERKAYSVFTRDYYVKGLESDLLSASLSG